MKKLFVLGIVLLSLLVVNSAFATPSEPPDNTAFLCKSLKEDYPGWFRQNFSSHGDCVSFHRLQQVEWCKEMYDNPPYDFGNIGLCVSYVRDYYR